ncbi:MAG: hypothetical protein ABSC56_12090 [Solirubrobacteraceae bacterium]|jgi:hypothetical protein
MAEPLAVALGDDASEDRLDAFAAAALEVASRAESVATTVSMDLSAGGIGIRLHVCGEPMAVHCRAALEQLQQTTQPLHELWAFDTLTSGLELPPPPWPRDAYGPRDGIAGLASPRYLFSYSLVPGCLSLLDRETRKGLFWTRDAARLPHWERSQPLRNLMRWIAREHDLHLLHAAVVGNAQGGILLTGPSGSGKSTTALACALLSHLRCLSDDMCLVADSEPPLAHRLYGVAKTDARELEALAGERSAVIGRNDLGQSVIRLVDLAPAGAEPLEAVPIRAIVSPRVGSASMPPERLRGRAALLAGGPPSALELPGGGASELALISSLLRRVPAFALTLGPDLRSNAACVASLLDCTP